MKKVLIFDFGNTIVSDESDEILHRMFYEEFIDKFNIPASIDEMADFLKNEVKKALEKSEEKWENLKLTYSRAFGKFLDSKGVKYTKEHKEIFEKLYLEYHEKYTEPFPDSIESLIKLKSLGFRLAIISNIDNEIIEPILRRLGTYELFELVLTSEELGFGKPNPKIFKEALKHLGIEPKDSIFIGDSLLNDVEGARKVGIEAIHYGVDCKNWKELFNEIIKRGGNLNGYNNKGSRPCR